ncbi:MAG: FadR family transcriptional regulator [Rhizobiales bacterium]|nr:FadR family transcriptional regulator [Hyphomicrobiales bacterium]
MSNEAAVPRNGSDAESEDPQLVANRGANSITARLRRAIETGVYSDGDQLPPERQLAVAFGTARSTIRKALDQLEVKGFVSRRVGSGTFVSYAGPVQDTMADVTDLISPLQLIETRFAIEPYMAKLATLHASARDLDAMQAVLDRIERVETDADAFTRLDSEFHLQLARCSRNPLIYRLYQQINTIRAHAQWEQMKQIILSNEKMAIYNQQHRAIVEALRQRDVQAAVDQISRHLETARQDLLGADSI